MLSFCLFKNKLHIASKTQQKIITIENDDEIAKHFWNEKPKTVLTLGGPYPFTRLRIVLSTAQGFAMGHGADYHFIKTFDFLNLVFPGCFFAFETRRGDFFTFHEELGEKLMSKEDVEKIPYPLISDETLWTFNLAEKLIDLYPKLTTSKDPYYFYTPEYAKVKPLA